ncbi:MAG: NB-ARC domain-containing protein [Prochloraceae cyanobacterium]
MLPVAFLTKIARKYELSPEQEETFIERFGKNKSEQETAQELYITQSAVRTRMSEIYRQFSIGGKGPGKYAKLLNFLNDEHRKTRGSEVDNSNDSSNNSVTQGLAVGKPFLAPPLPEYFVERPEIYQELKQRLLDQETARAGTLVVSAIYGLGGIGKSTLAAALAHDPEVQSHFPDGIFWATLGQQPDILDILSIWSRKLGDYDFKPINLNEASLELKSLLSDKQALLVVDDVWNSDQAKWFRMEGVGCRVLVTTREAQIEGAEYHSLDLMSEAQALSLLRQKLQQQWIEEQTAEVKAFVKVLGYLPLALDLAANQVRSGLTWTELRSEFEEERQSVALGTGQRFSALKLLDSLEAWDCLDENEQRKYSLPACFNLSLKRLSPEQLQQFVWLGVLPEDVNLSAQVAAVLWNLSLPQTKRMLALLRQRSFLTDGAETSEGEPTYRIHDLMHDLARNLIEEGGILETQNGKSKIQSLSLAHCELLERYQKKTEKGLWHTLPDDGYIYSQLIWHMEKAELLNEIHQLLQEETPEGYNGWYWQCERQGKTANFVKYVSRAWARAETNFTQNPTESISLQCRYALITTSLNSLAKNIPPELIAALVEKEIWTPAQGFAYVRQSKDSSHQAEGLKAIAKYLPPSLFPEALDAARAIESEYFRAEALQGLAPHLTENLLPEALDAARAIESEYFRAEALQGLAPHFPEVLPEALDAARAIEFEDERAEALQGLAPHLTENLFPETLDAARAIEDEHNRARALQG